MRSTSSPLAVSMMIGIVLLGAAQAPADRQAVLAGQHQVEHQQVDSARASALVHAGRVGCGVDGEALFAQIALQQFAQAHVVVDDEDLGFSLRHARILSSGGGGPQASRNKLLLIFGAAAREGNMLLHTVTRCQQP